MVPVSERFIQSQIERGKRLIERYNVVFFDVFDTLLARDCAAPADVFPLVEERYNRSHPEAPISGFSDLHRAAEHVAAEKRRAPTFEQVYAELDLEEKRKSELKTIELETERALSTKKYTGYALYRCAKERGRRVVAVSDMYLSAETIRELLCASGYEVDDVIVSCEHGAEKYNGKLFRIALERTGANRGEVVHFGDNPVCDILGAHLAGIASLWLPARKQLAYMKPCGDHFSDHYLLPFVANRVPLMENRVEALGYETCGPMLVGFCQWLHEKLHAGGYQKALFCARDLRQTLDIYLRMYPEDAYLASYFYVSRKSLTLPYEAAIGKNDSEEAAEQLELLLQYLTQLGCKGKVAYIDSGLLGRSQNMLSSIAEGRFDLHGMYLRISKEFFKIVQDPETMVYLYPEQPETKHFISAIFFESLIAAVHGSTISYIRDPNGTIVPKLGSAYSDSDLIKEFQQGIRIFAENYLKSLSHRYKIDERSVHDSLLNLAFFPQRKDVVKMESVKCGNLHYEPIISRKKKAFYFFHPISLLFDLQKNYWKGGFLRSVFPLLSPFFCHIYLAIDCYYLDRFGRWKKENEPN